MNIKSTQAEIIEEQYAGNVPELMDSLNRSQLCKHIAQDWEDGATTWTMEDNSEVCIMGEDVHVSRPEDVA